jgi:hypothetical protein
MFINAPIILHTGFGGFSGLPDPVGPLPTDAAFTSGSAMWDVECSSGRREA